MLLVRSATSWCVGAIELFAGDSCKKPSCSSIKANTDSNLILGCLRDVFDED